MSKTEQMEQEKADATGALLAAEARYLQAHGWVPFSVQGKIRWKKDGGALLPQYVAMRMQTGGDSSFREQ